jgi:hypothetical protein
VPTLTTRSLWTSWSRERNAPARPCNDRIGTRAVAGPSDSGSVGGAPAVRASGCSELESGGGGHPVRTSAGLPLRASDPTQHLRRDYFRHAPCKGAVLAPRAQEGTVSPSTGTSASSGRARRRRDAAPAPPWRDSSERRHPRHRSSLFAALFHTGGGTRTPDTRIMIQTIPGDLSSLSASQLRSVLLR